VISREGEDPVDSGRTQDLNEAARRFAETLADSYKLVYEQAAEAGERQQQRAQEFSELVASSLREQTEASRAGAGRLSEQAQRQQQAGQQLARESVEAYAEFLDDAFSRYRSGTERAAQTVQEGVQTTGRTATGLLGAATGAVADATGRTADAAASGAEQAAEAVAFPIEGYDQMNVDEISSRLEGLSVEELQLVRDYEELHEGRKTLLEQMDRKIRAASS
jgi:hypothetical protein